MIFLFGGFQLDTQLMELRRDESPVPIEPRVFDVLRLLIENRDRLVGKDELIEKVWDGRIVSEVTLSSCMYSVRRAVDDDGKRQAVIQTLPRRGFRFVQPVEIMDEAHSRTMEGNSISQAAGPHKHEVGSLPTLPDKPSIAVLPFQNMSGDPEQEYFSDGISEDLSTELSRNPWLFVIARNSGLPYRGDSVDVKRVGRELGVRYVVQGSVRRSDGRVRVAAQLIDAANGRQVWAERYDRPTGELFDLQDEITEAIAGTLVPALDSAERERVFRKPTQNLDAWEAYQRGLWHYYRPYKEDDQTDARRLFDRAIELDPGFADPHALLALIGVYAILTDSAASPKETLAEAAQAAETAVQLEDKSALAHAALARVHLLTGDHDTAIAEGETAIALNPSLAAAHYSLGTVHLFFGSGDHAIQSFDRAIRLSPNDPLRWSFFHLKSISLLEMGEYEHALDASKTAARLRPSAFWPHVGSAAALAGLDQLDDARSAVGDARSRNPAFSLAYFARWRQNFHASPFLHFFELLRKAGVPE